MIFQWHWEKAWYNRLTLAFASLRCIIQPDRSISELAITAIRRLNTRKKFTSPPVCSLTYLDCSQGGHSISGDNWSACTKLTVCVGTLALSQKATLLTHLSPPMPTEISCINHKKFLTFSSSKSLDWTITGHQDSRSHLFSCHLIQTVPGSWLLICQTGVSNTLSVFFTYLQLLLRTNHLTWWMLLVHGSTQFWS